MAAFLVSLLYPFSVPAEEVFIEAPLPQESLGAVPVAGGRVSAHGNVTVLVIFAKFKGEDPGDNSVPDFANGLFDSQEPGSFAHFYRTMSFDQLKVKGRVLPHRFTSVRPAAAFVAPNADEHGNYGDFVQEILPQVDAEIDLGQFDNNGPDGVPNSGDDDGVVDYIFVVLHTVPANFLWGPATGIATLGFETYRTEDLSAKGDPILVAGDNFHGTILQARSFSDAVGSMTHEFGHAIGVGPPLPDLYDRSHLKVAGQEPVEYSAGIGKWGLMGLGATGWHDDDGPNPFCAWSLEQLGWIGPQNQRLVQVQRDSTGVHIGDLFAGGQVYKIPLETEVVAQNIFPHYLLLEYRSRTSHHYNRAQPGEGLLVWRVRSAARIFENDKEENKMVDLVCADGLFGDGGFDIGRVEAPHQGRDNLDYWSQDEDYRRLHAGNRGDNTDFFDGQSFARFSSETNPSSRFASAVSSAHTGVALSNIRPVGAGLQLDITLPRWAGTINEKVEWAGQILVDGDLSVAPQGHLIIYPDTQVQIAGSDRLQTGQDPERVEIEILGKLTIMPSTRRYEPQTEKFERLYASSAPVVFAPLEAGQTWGGIRAPKPLDSKKVKTRGVVAGPALSAAAVGSADTAQEREAPPDRATVVEETEDWDAQLPPDTFALLPNYPNPFAASTTLPYTLAAAAEVKLQVYNTLGQMVRQLVDGYQEAGQHQIQWQARDEGDQPVASGVYLYRLEVPGHFAEGHKMLFLPAGYAQVSSLEQKLSARGSDWSVLRVQLVDLPESDLGLFGVSPSADQAAFTAGLLLVNLGALLGTDPNAGEIQSYAEHLLQGAAAFDPTTERLQALEGALDKLNPQQALQELAGIRRQLLNLVQGPSALYFHLGEWLQNIKLAGLAARRLNTPLSAMLDLNADAETGRHFAAALAADQAVLNALERLAEQLEADPPTSIGRLLDQVDSLAEVLSGR